MTSRDRIIQFVEYKGISKNRFYKETGLSNGFLDKNNHPGADKLEQIIYAYPDISPEWLLTGSGLMLRDKEPIRQQEPEVRKSDVSDNDGIIAFLKSELKERNIEIAELNKQIGRLEEQIEEMKKSDDYPLHGEDAGDAFIAAVG